jgi:hypothetical protein
MRLAFKLALAAALTLALPAASQQPASDAGLKGAKTEAGSAPVQPPASPPPQTPIPAPGGLFALQTPAQIAEQCRADCARAYYFCLSSDSPDNCPQSWGQCRQSCTGALNGR